MTSGNRRAPLGAALFFTGLLAALTAPAEAQNAYRGLPPEALMRAAEQAPAVERGALLEAFLDDRAGSLSVLRNEARSGSREAKLLAAGMLAEMRDSGAVAALLDASKDADEQVRQSALAALRTLGDRRAARRFRELVRSGGRGGPLKLAAAGLGKVGGPADLALLRGLLANGDESVRVTAAGALAMLGSDEGLQVLLDAVDGDNPLAQKNATYALGFVRAAAASERLQRLLDDPQGRWKSYALIASAQRQQAAQSRADQIASLTLLGRGRDRIAADWAIDQLTDLEGPEATEVLRELGTRSGPLGAKARLRARVREGR
jgi:HEAT repeat protein